LGQSLTESTRQGEPAGAGGVPTRERYGLILGLILIGYVFDAAAGSRVIVVVDAVLFLSLLLVALWSPGIPHRLRRIGIAACFALLVVIGVLALNPAPEATGVAFLLLAATQLLALLAILARIAQHDHVGIQTVMGAVAGYALIAFMMGALYHGLDLIDDGDFLNGVVAVGDYTYFSIVTLTTVGYGDITAASDLAKRLVAVEAFMGQIFLITLVARLVSLWGQPVRGRRSS
jgi:voltage-gated potassium channel Kch